MHVDSAATADLRCVLLQMLSYAYPPQFSPNGYPPMPMAFHPQVLLLLSKSLLQCGALAKASAEASFEALANDALQSDTAGINVSAWISRRRCSKHGRRGSRPPPHNSIPSCSRNSRGQGGRNLSVQRLAGAAAGRAAAAAAILPGALPPPLGPPAAPAPTWRTSWQA